MKIQKILNYAIKFKYLIFLKILCGKVGEPLMDGQLITMLRNFNDLLTVNFLYQQ